MKQRVILIGVLLLLFAAGCGSSSSPPGISMNVNGESISGLQGAYCWDQTFSPALCVDPFEPMFTSFLELPANAPILLELERPLPDELNLYLTKEVFGDEIYEEDVAPASLVEWSPPVQPGDYILNADATWKQGDVTYRFAITIP